MGTLVRRPDDRPILDRISERLNERMVTDVRTGLTYVSYLCRQSGHGAQSQKRAHHSGSPNFNMARIGKKT
jgi:hypothetical protein